MERHRHVAYLLAAASAACQPSAPRPTPTPDPNASIAVARCEAAVKARYRDLEVGTPAIPAALGTNKWQVVGSYRFRASRIGTGAGVAQWEEVRFVCRASLDGDPMDQKSWTTRVTVNRLQ